MTNPANLFGLLGAALGVVALALPFSGGAFPVGALHPDVDLWARMIAWSAMLSIPIAAWQLGGLRRSTPGPLAIALAYVLSTAAMLPALWLSAQLARTWWGELEESIAFAVLASCWGLATCNAVLLVHNTRRHVASRVTAEVFLLGGYLPSAALALLLFYPFYGGPERGPNLHRHIFIFMGWDPGAYAVLIACISFAIRIALLQRQPGSNPPRRGAATEGARAAADAERDSNTAGGRGDST